MKKNIRKVVVIATLATTLSGCAGSMAVTGLVMKGNIVAVDNRYARGGLNMLLAPVYALSVAADYLVFNSIGFWTGTNIINGKTHIFDTKVDTLLDINDALDPSLNEAPIPEIPMDPIAKIDYAEKSVYSAQTSIVNENTLDFNIVYTNGDEVTLRGEKKGDMVDFYLDGKFVTTASMNELEKHIAPKV